VQAQVACTIRLRWSTASCGMHQWRSDCSFPHSCKLPSQAQTNSHVVEVVCLSRWWTGSSDRTRLRWSVALAGVGSSSWRMRLTPRSSASAGVPHPTDSVSAYCSQNLAFRTSTLRTRILPHAHASTVMQSNVCAGSGATNSSVATNESIAFTDPAVSKHSKQQVRGTHLLTQQRTVLRLFRCSLLSRCVCSCRDSQVIAATLVCQQLMRRR
jgi:hypothetical protein